MGVGRLNLWRDRILSRNSRASINNSTNSIQSFAGGSLEHRGVFEFDLSSLAPGSVIDAASFTVYTSSLGYTNGVTVELFAHSGDGVLSAGDAAAGTRIGSLSIDTAGDDLLRRYTISLDPAVLQSLAQDGNYVTLSARMTLGSGFSVYSKEASFVPASDRPTLQVVVSDTAFAPVATDDQAGGVEDQPLAIDVLANDTDADGGTLAIESFSQPANGSVTLNPDGTFTYVPNPDFSGTDSFTYLGLRGSHGQ